MVSLNYDEGGLKGEGGGEVKGEDDGGRRCWVPFMTEFFSNVAIQSIDAKSENLSVLSKIIFTRFLSK